MNGAESLVRTLAAAGIDVCFANPGTSEMHFVAALDKVGGIRCVLGLFEGVVTGAADGYARMAGKPAVTLLHLGPGLGNGLANLHNARKAKTPVVNIVGEHALRHIEHDAPLTADIEGIAGPVSNWVRTCQNSADLASDAADAVAAARQFPGGIATLILPANTAWDAATAAADALVPVSASAVPDHQLERVASLLRDAKPDATNVAIVLGGHCVHAEGLELADRIAQKTGATLLAETSNARFERGAGRVSVKAIPYPVDQALELLAPFDHIVTVNAKAPVAFFAYPEKPSCLYREDATVTSLSSHTEDGVNALRSLCQLLDADHLAPRLQNESLPPMPTEQTLQPDTIAAVLANRLPEQAIVVDEAITTGRNFQSMLAGAKAHDWLQLCGGSIGDGFPLATGAAIACPERKVIDLQADGSGMYTLQALWTQAREQLDITTVVFANRTYEILKHELRNVNAESGTTAGHMMELDRPTLDWVKL
ncbi:MAG: acetolactate synthase large subunit, partial [Gammaproteobacteria bacterium]|nr:acetolactate synthase large subunit [Gammaproteobacteria bacterium]